MLARRKFLKAFGVGTVAAPLAAKAAAEDAAKALTLRGYNEPLASMGAPDPQWLGAMPASVSGGNDEKLFSYIRSFGRLPEHVERQKRIETRCVYFLDPDIASKRAWSLNVKIQEQRQRNYDRAVAELMSHNWYGRAREAFQKSFGFYW